MATFFPKIKSNFDVLRNEKRDNENPQLLQQKGRPHYQLGDAKVPHLLPPPVKLKPYTDRIAGEMETWPANSNAMLNSHVKPLCLQKLDGYLKRELRIQGSASKPSERRLQAFREVFAYLIDDFRTYKPLLSAIKQEYENMLTFQKETIRSLEPLQAMIVNINDQCEQKVLNLKHDDKKDLALANKRNAELEDAILTLKEEIISLKQQVKKCQGDVEDVYTKYRDEADSKKLLIQSMNDLKYQQEDTKKKDAIVNDENGQKEGEDCVFLRIALKKAREDLDKKNIKLAEVMADYGDVVPRRDFEKMEAEFGKTKDSFESLRGDYDILCKEHDALIDVHKKLVEQRDLFASDYERMRVSATPRPDWDKCALYIEGGQDRWLDMSSGCSTNDKVDILLAEMTGQDIESVRSGVGGIVDFFEPRGLSADVPAYLHSNERVRNRHLGKRDTLVRVKDIWQQKVKEEGNLPFSNHMPLSDYLYQYLKQNFSVENLVIEWGYNLHDALLRYGSDNNISIFYRILTGDLDEDVYYDNLSQLEGLYRLFAVTDVDKKGELKREEFEKCLSSRFPNISTEDLSSILNIVGNELNVTDCGSIMYSNLFHVDDEGNTGPFINQIQDLMKEDKQKYLNEIASHFDNKVEISNQDLNEAFLAIDPNLSEEVRQKYVGLCFNGNDADKIDVQSVIMNLHRSCIRRC